MNSDDRVSFDLPAVFVIPRVRLEPGELAYGYAHGWIDDASVVDIATDLLAAGAPSAPLQELACVFRAELWRVQRLVDEIETEPGSEPERVWLYLALAWLHDHRREHADPLQLIEMLYADFGYPTEIETLVRYMPATPGAPTGVMALEERWTDYLRQKSSEYAMRR
ncbi:DUF2247 family protein [Sanguibacter sp. 25GB23B1]|uniref:DUF2247 family protein n=1 Tax=unclassified Sanguibacter TaxID=2645534 RepID=UPI0032AF9154